MSRILLLCFIHGFKGADNTFHTFPEDLERQVSKKLPDHRVQQVVYPKYETKGELTQATDAFVEWLKERVIDCRKTHLENPWPPTDRNVGVILVAHSMGGFVAADALFLAMRSRASEGDQIFPLIQGILAFDTPYNGLARSMFVYGAFSNYQKVSSVFNAMTALSVAAPASLGRLASNRAAASAASASKVAKSPTAWQMIAVKTGTVGAIAAGGVAAYTHRASIMSGVKGIKNINRESIVEGYHQGIDSISQGLAYINRGSVGASFAWLSDHFTFVGSLLKQKELVYRLDRLAAVRGVGVHNFYCSLGENGYWSGGYFVPERTFCAVPGEEHSAKALFERRVMPEVGDEVQAHMSMFRADKHKGYEGMTERAAELAKEWFLSEEPAIDAGYRDEDNDAEEKFVKEAIEKAETVATEKSAENTEEAGDTTHENATEKDDVFPDESPMDIAAAAALVTLPDSDDNLATEEERNNPVALEKRTYRQYLFELAQQAGTGAKGWLPTKLPDMPNLPNAPNMPKVQIPSTVSSLGQSVPNMNIFGKKTEAPGDAVVETKEDDCAVRSSTIDDSGGQAAPKT